MAAFLCVYAGSCLSLCMLMPAHFSMCIWTVYILYRLLSGLKWVMVMLCSGQCCNGSGVYFWMRNASIQLKAILELTWTWGTHAQLHTDSISNSGLNLALLPYDKVNHLNCFSFMKFKPMHVLNKYYTPSSFTISTINVVLPGDSC